MEMIQIILQNVRKRVGPHVTRPLIGSATRQNGTSQKSWSKKTNHVGRTLPSSPFLRVVYTYNDQWLANHEKMILLD